MGDAAAGAVGKPACSLIAHASVLTIVCAISDLPNPLRNAPLHDFNGTWLEVRCCSSGTYYRSACQRRQGLPLKQRSIRSVAACLLIDNRASSAGSGPCAFVRPQEAMVQLPSVRNLPAYQARIFRGETGGNDG
jgi:hypothetical protein